MTETYSRPDSQEFAHLLEWAKQNPPGPQERNEQAISWARGELRLQHPEMTWQEADNRARLAFDGPGDTERSNNDAHYRNCAIEPIEIIEANGLDYHEGNVLKYLLRWRYKGGIADLEKAIWYLERLKENKQ